MDSYHEKYSAQSDAEIQNKVLAKREELEAIFNQLHYQPSGDSLRVAVLGCADKRFVPAHKNLFAELTGKTIELTTFDITIEHMSGEEGVIEHDCTMPIPNPPYDITYAHVILKFIEPDKQWSLVSNSCQALGAGGLAIHVLDTGDYQTKDDQEADVDLEAIRIRLQAEGIQFIEVPIKYGIALVLTK